MCAMLKETPWPLGCAERESAPGRDKLNRQANGGIMVISRRAFGGLVIALMLALAIHNQASAQRGGSRSGSGTRNSSSNQPVPLLRLEVNRVPVDVVVTDKNGKPVLGLSKDDFTVTEDKKPQRILSFDYMDGTQPSFTPAKLPPLPTNTFVNEPVEAERGPLYVLYYDMVNTDLEDQGNVRKQLLDFVDHAAPGTRFSLWMNATGMHMIQGFTSDRAVLREAILSKGPGPHLPQVFIEGRVFGYQDSGAVMSNLTFLAEYLSGIPGRKNLIWLSGYFPIPVGPTIVGNNQVGSSSVAGTDYLNLTDLQKVMIKQTYAALMRSQIALYPVDIKGNQAENEGGDAVMAGRQMDAIAGATGGRAYYGNNRVEQMMDQAVENGESYYTLTYDPSNKKLDENPRTIEVTLGSAKSMGYTVIYRTLYYTVSSEDVQNQHKKEEVQARFLAAKTTDTLYANIEHGAPMLHDMLFSAHVTAEGEPVMATAEQMAQLEDSPAYFRTRKRDTTPKPLTPVKLQKYAINYGVFDPQLKSLAAHGGKPAVLEFAAAAYDGEGKLLNSMLNEGQAPTGADANGKSGGIFHAEQELEVPPGAAWIRLAVRDTLNNRTGTMEVKLPLRGEAASGVAGNSK